MQLLLNISLVLFSCSIYEISSLLSCKNENNKDIDWFIILKIPASYNYLYLSSDSANIKWTIPNYALNDVNNLLAVTLRQKYSSVKDGTFFASYNDAKPWELNQRKKSNVGHMKGVINFDKKTGYWLVHSVPKFPPTDKYLYTDGESINGQAFLCVTLRFTYLDSIVHQLLMTYADVYDYNIPLHYTDNPDLMAALYRLVMNEHSPRLLSRRIDLTTVAGVKMSHFGKSHDDFQDLYLDIICPGLNVSLFVESWMQGGEKLRSSCATKYKVYNVERVSIDGITFPEEIDHSKWAVSLSNNTGTICIGDINRMVTQKSRGGGSLCLLDASIWKTFSPIVKEYEPCRKFDFIL